MSARFRRVAAGASLSIAAALAFAGAPAVVPTTVATVTVQAAEASAKYRQPQLCVYQARSKWLRHTKWGTRVIDGRNYRSGSNLRQCHAYFGEDLNELYSERYWRWVR